jgi:hypothetical protein
VKGHKAWRNFLELRLGEVRRINRGLVINKGRAMG